MSATGSVDIKLNGREFRVACSPEEMDSLQAAASLLDAKMGELAKQTRSTGERLAVMAALNLAHELISLKNPPAPIDEQEARRRIQAMEASLDAVLIAQEGAL
jgi:cell division protein ZapA